ncbi:MAG: cyclic nucleotide-binding domain-containing protein [Coraliomargarita sp.]
MITRNYAAGELIVREGDAAESAFYLVSGTVEVFVDASGSERFVAEQHAGDFFGEMGMILEEPRMASIRAKTDVVAEEYDIKSFEEDVIGNRERRNAYMPNLFERIRVVSSMLRNAIDEEVGSNAYEVEAAQSEEAVAESSVEVSSVKFKSVKPLDGASACVDLSVKSFPFNIGRHSESKVLVENDFYLDDTRPHQVSRGHCAIERRGDAYVVRDRFSYCGTILNGESLGKGGSSFVGALQMGDNELILGDQNSSFRFIVTLA